ncbi:SRPBCC domain-containing protein [Aldersonia sp. NBC_00410]|uniref:SRPBCC family protein n=1 Tax=Aldersonia sp. NBC_00410 TaxID=2975954 RepID=UPI0022534FBD|nr:SRPBCC domain-containing protein [Aldersonia sp. NBC_00410]MCX5043505.1 SRPBCC domain-containing protein [Aldersonia sp. NBC_00410]
MLKPFELDRVVDLPADPATVFEAVSTGTGGWMFPSEIEPAVGGDNGDAKTARWVPGRRLTVAVGDESAWYNTLDYEIEPTETGSRLRYQHRSVLEDDVWDVQFAACDRHTDFYLHTLGEYVDHFPGRAATYVDVNASEASATPDGFAKLRSALGVEAVGQRVRIDVTGLGVLDATVDFANSNFIGLRTEDAMYRFFGRNAWGGPVGMSAHVFAESDPDTIEKALQAWLDGIYE